MVVGLAERRRREVHGKLVGNEAGRGRTIALDPVLVVGDGLASAARQGTGAASLGAPAIFRPATIPRSL
jgi:hypothetical protein